MTATKAKKHVDAHELLVYDAGRTLPGVRVHMPALIPPRKETAA